MEFEINRDSACATVLLQEDLIAPLTQELRQHLKQLLEDGIRTIVFDMSGVSLVDSLGIGLMIMCHNSLKKIGGNFSVIHVALELMDEFRPMRLDRHFTITA